MGHVEMLHCNLYISLLFIRMDGGSNGWDREYNYKKVINFNAENMIISISINGIIN